jgi:hypothetical protein
MRMLVPEASASSGAAAKAPAQSAAGMANMARAKVQQRYLSRRSPATIGAAFTAARFETWLIGDRSRSVAEATTTTLADPDRRP